MIRPICFIVAFSTMSLPIFGGVLFFVNDTSGFDTSRGSTTLAGTEDFELAFLPPNSMATVMEPLAPGILNPPFSSGTVVETGMTVQSNSLGNNPVNPSPSGEFAITSYNYFGAPSNQVRTSGIAQSFDLIFALPQTTAVSFGPLVFDSIFIGNPGSVTVRVYDSSNNLIGSMVNIQVAGFVNPTTVIGVIATEGDDIGRINIFSTGLSANRFTGVDNINVYTGVVPVELQSFTIE